MTTNEKMRNLTIFSQFHTLYVKLLDLIKKASIKNMDDSIITPQEALCLIQLFEYKSKNYTGDSGLKNLAKRTNNIADHLMFQLNNLSRKGLVTIKYNEISLTENGNLILESLSNSIPEDILTSLDKQMTNLNKILK